jgi:proteasome inhibitor subunit 1 (PI31)
MAPPGSAPPGSATGSATGAAVLAVLRASRPRCRGRGDVLAFALHAATMAEGYRLLAAGPAADADDPAHASSSDPAAGWNAWEDAYAFRYARDEPAGSPAASASAEAPVEILVKTLVVGDAAIVSAAVVSAAVVSAPAATAPSRDRPVHAAEYSLDAVVRGSGSGDEPPSAEDGGTIPDAAAALADTDALVADAREKLFAPLARDAAARASSAGEEEESDGRRDAVGSRRVRPIPDDDDTGGGGFFPPGTYPPRGSPRAPGPRGVFFPGPAPPRGARFDPYGPPDIPEFAPGRFDGGTLPGFGFPENPDAAFGGVPDGFGGGGAFGGGESFGRKAPRRRGRDPDSPRG